LRIIIHDYPGHPFQVQLSRELAKRGHDVLHIFAGYNQTPRGSLIRKLSDPIRFTIEALYIKEPLEKYSFIKRWRQEREYGRLLAAKVDDFQPDLVVSSNTPLDSQSFLIQQCQKNAIPFYFWLQDVTGLATYMILKKKLPVIGNLIGKYYINVERRLLNESDKIILITEDFLSLLNSWEIDQTKTVIIPNWAPIDEIQLQSRNNHWARDHGLIDKLCLMYTGTLGLKHNPHLLLELANHYRNRPNVVIVIISETIGAKWLRDKKDEQSLNNLIILEFQPFDQMQYVLASADVLVAILEEDAGIFSVPSKVLTYLCSQRPLLLAVPKMNLAARIVSENQSGIVVSSNEPAAFTQAADELIQNPDMRKMFGMNARAYAEKNFNIQLITDQFEKVLIS
jgi:glycosyltransferase involved in cell wall biosynthesis